MDREIIRMVNHLREYANDMFRHLNKRAENIEGQIEGQVESRLANLARRVNRLEGTLQPKQDEDEPPVTKSSIGRAAMRNRMKRMGLSVVMGGIDPDAGPFTKKGGAS